MRLLYSRRDPSRDEEIQLTLFPGIPGSPGKPGRPSWPRGPGLPGKPLGPSGDMSPFSPFGPGRPGIPGSPWRPGFPGSPGSPFWPGRPEGPGGPGTATSPLLDMITLGSAFWPCKKDESLNNWKLFEKIHGQEIKIQNYQDNSMDNNFKLRSLSMYG